MKLDPVTGEGWSPSRILSTLTRPALKFIGNPIRSVMTIHAGKDTSNREVVACFFTDILHSYALIVGYDFLPFDLHVELLFLAKNRVARDGLAVNDTPDRQHSFAVDIGAVARFNSGASGAAFPTPRS